MNTHKTVYTLKFLNCFILLIISVRKVSDVRRLLVKLMTLFGIKVLVTIIFDKVNLEKAHYKLAYGIMTEIENLVTSWER